MIKPEDSFGGLEHGIRKRREQVEELERLSAGCIAEETKLCLESLAWLGAAVADVSLAVYEQLQNHQLEHFPPDKTVVVAGLIALASTVRGGQIFRRGIEFGSAGIRLHDTADGTRWLADYLEQFTD